jgi:Putative adhesin
MNRRILIIALVLLCATFALAAEGTFNRTLNVGANAEVEIGGGSGNITVHSGEAGKISIVGHVKTSNYSAWNWFGGSGSADDKIKRIVDKPPVEQSGNWVRVGRIEDESLRNGISIDYDVTVPKDTRLRANTGSGDVRVEDVSASVSAHTGSGNMRLRNLAGEVEAQAGSGDIEAFNLGGPIRVRTGSGNVHVQSSGNGDVRAGAGSGDLTIDGVKGGLEASTGSGNIRASGNPGDRWTLHTGSGDVHLALEKNAKFTIEARSMSGSVRSDMPITVSGTMERHAIRGSVNGGGPTVEVHTGSGNIEVLSR